MNGAIEELRRTQEQQDELDFQQAVQAAGTKEAHEFA
jgi:hypothetical protein